MRAIALLPKMALLLLVRGGHFHPVRGAYYRQWDFRAETSGALRKPDRRQPEMSIGRGRGSITLSRRIVVQVPRERQGGADEYLGPVAACCGVVPKRACPR